MTTYSGLLWLVRGMFRQGQAGRADGVAPQVQAAGQGGEKADAGAVSSRIKLEWRSDGGGHPSHPWSSS